jgi:folate-dependent phosphoribosylglycinamide formyltransferase PurN
MLSVALLCSRRAPGLAYLLRENERRGETYEVVAGLTTDPESEALAALRGAHVPAIVHDIRAFYAARGAARTDLTVRRAYDERTLELLAPFAPDLLVLTGYLHIVTAPLLAAYPQRVINVHDADLTVLAPDGRPRYRGLHATRDALRAGERATRCTVHLVTADVDGGPPLARSMPFPVGGRHHYVQREWMMREAWGCLIEEALRVIRVNRRGEASRRTVEENRTAYALPHPPWDA